MPRTCISSIQTDIPSRCIKRKQKRPEVASPAGPRQQKKAAGQARRSFLGNQLRLLAAEEVPVAALRGRLLRVARRIEQLVDRRAAVADRSRARVVNRRRGRLVGAIGAIIVATGESAAGNGQNGGSCKDDLL